MKFSTPRLSTLTTFAQGLSPRDRRALSMGLGIIVGVLLVGGAVTLNERAAAARERVQQKRALLAQMPAALDVQRRIKRLGTDAALPLGSLVRRLLDLQALAADVQVNADGGVTVALIGVSVDATLEFIADLHAHRVNLRQARIERSSGSGIVNARLELAPRASPVP